MLKLRKFAYVAAMILIGMSLVVPSAAAAEQATSLVAKSIITVPLGELPQGEGMFSFPPTVVPDKDGGYIVIANHVIKKLDSQFQTVWSNDLLQPYDRLYDVRPITDGHYIVLATVYPDSESQGHTYIAKLDKDGHAVWEKSIKLGDVLSNVMHIQEAEDGGFFAYGYSFSGRHYGASQYVIKLNVEGEKQWERILEHPKAMIVHGKLLPLPDGGFLYAGSVEYNQSSSNAYYAKFDKEGKRVWDKLFEQKHNAQFNHAVPVDGGFILTGETYQDKEGPLEQDMFIVKLDMEGNLVWERFYGEDHRNEMAYETVPTLDGDYLVFGRRMNKGHYTEPYILKLDVHGTVRWVKTFPGHSIGGHILHEEPGEYRIVSSNSDFIVDDDDFNVSYANTVLIEMKLTENLQLPASKDIRAIVNGQLVQFDVAPVVQHGRTLVPIRALADALGADTSWNESRREATVMLDGDEIILPIGRNLAYVNGEEVMIDVAPQIINGRTFIPFRFVGTALGCDIFWDEEARIVTVTQY